MLLLTLSMTGQNVAGATHSPSEQGVKEYFEHYTQSTHSVNYNVQNGLYQNNVYSEGHYKIVLTDALICTSLKLQLTLITQRNP